MRQAIIVKNPKWEPFTTVSNAWKAITVKDGETAVLVVRGRAKEKNVKTSKSLKSGKTAEWLKSQTPDIVEKMKKTASKLIIAALMLFAFGVSAQEVITAKAGGATIAAFSTNTATGNGVIGWNIGQVAVFQLTCVGTNAAVTNNVILKMDTSDNGTDWLANQYTISNTPAGLTKGTSITKVTNTVGGKWLKVNRIENLNETYVTMGLTVSLKAD